jgi:hypothetical protein
MCAHTCHHRSAINQHHTQVSASDQEETIRKASNEPTQGKEVQVWKTKCSYLVHVDARVCCLLVDHTECCWSVRVLVLLLLLMLCCCSLSCVALSVLCSYVFVSFVLSVVCCFLLSRCSVCNEWMALLWMVRQGRRNGMDRMDGWGSG